MPHPSAHTPHAPRSPCDPPNSTSILQEPYGTLFVSIPSLLDPSICPPGTHVFHAFTPDWIDAWSSLQPGEYEQKKAEVTDAVLARLEAFFPGLREAVVFRWVLMSRWPGHRKRCCK